MIHVLLASELKKLLYSLFLSSTEHRYIKKEKKNESIKRGASDIHDRIYCYCCYCLAGSVLQLECVAPSTLVRPLVHARAVHAFRQVSREGIQNKLRIQIHG